MSKNILVVIDCQNDFIDGSLRNDDAIKAVPNIVKKINEFNGDYILVTLDTHEDNYLETNEGKMLPVEHCIENTDGWKLNNDIENAIKNKEKEVKVRYFEKPTFGSIDLQDFFDFELDGCDVNVEYVGFCTDICVISNVLMEKAVLFDRANITVDASCCAGVTPEKHKAALETMKSCQINIINE